MQAHPDFNPQVDPKCSWALRHLDFFPVEVNRADYEALLRIPGVGVVSARRILAVPPGPARCASEDLPKLGVVLKRAQYFLTASGRMARRPAVHTGQPAAESDRGGAALPAPTGAGADVPVCPCVREVPHDRDDL